MWYVGALSKPHNLGEYLVKSVLIKDESPGMYLNLREIDENNYQNILDKSKIKIEHVSNPNEEEQWIDVCITSFELAEIKEHASRVWQFFFKFCDAYLATFEGKPVGASMVFYGSGVAGIYNVAVCPEFRNRRIGTELTMAPLLQAQKRRVLKLAY